MSPRVAQRKKDTRARIVRASLELFAEKGIEATTVAEISEAADIGKGTFFTYFPSKEAVFADIGDLMLEMMSEGVETKASEGSTLAEQLAHVLVPGIEWHQQNPSLSRLSFTVLMRAPSAIDADAANISALESLLAGLVKEGQATGAFRQDLEPEAAAVALLGLYFMSIHRWHRDGASSSLVDSFLRGLAVIMKGLAK